ncbi:MAG: hydrogenase expression/formation protein HypE [Spirochaetales bacterium]|nr:hydrogenase expression/formation protein HypE [Spirochaetales bacterium]
MSERVVLDHGSGGRRSRDLVRSVFRSRLSNAALDAETDAAVVALALDASPAGDVSNAADVRIAMTTDAHVVKPLRFPGGDIGRLAVCGTVNDLAVSGAEPRYLTASFIIEEGFPIADLESIVDSMADAATEAGIRVVAGDTKVVGRGECDGLFITTSGVGIVGPGREGIAGASRVAAGDVILVNGPIGDHGATIACVRNGIDTDPPLASDCAPLSGLIQQLYNSGITPHFMRDATRGGLATVLCELADMRSIQIQIREESIPVRDTVRGVCEIYGFDPLYLANEGTMICVVDQADASVAIQAMQAHPLGQSAVIVGEVLESGSARAVMRTAIGGRRVLRMLAGEQLPRIC